jgi:hypothetical protein
MEGVDRADFDAIGIFALDAVVDDDESHGGNSAVGVAVGRLYEECGHGWPLLDQPIQAPRVVETLSRQQQSWKIAQIMVLPTRLELVFPP